MEKNYFLSVLTRSLNEGLVVSVYSDQNEPANCSVGFIDALSSEQFVMKHITPEGINDGYIIRRLKDIFRVDINGEYERKIGLLYSLQKQKHEDFIKKAETENDNLFVESLIIARNQNLIITVCIDETENQDDVVGFVKDVNSKGITIARISFNGIGDGESTFLVEDVIKMNCDTTDEKTLKLLFSHRKH